MSYFDDDYYDDENDGFEPDFYEDYYDSDDDDGLPRHLKKKEENGEQEGKPKKVNQQSNVATKTAANNLTKTPAAKKKLKHKAGEAAKQAAVNVTKQVTAAIAKIFSNPYAWIVLLVVICVIALFVAILVISQKYGITLDAENVIMDSLQEGVESLE